MIKLSERMTRYEDEIGGDQELYNFILEVAQLEAELADWHDRRDETFQEYEDCKAEVDALREANARGDYANERLRAFAWHDGGCPAFSHDLDECTCGLDALLEGKEQV